MALTPGTRLGPYEILSTLGTGGMGEVYRAWDTRLEREVALKVLPEAIGADPERLARFQREAQVLAALNHPHIAAIYGLEKSGDVEALVLELVEGETLAEKIAAGPVPIEETLAIAPQIADALEAAHEKGIVHRDLKPANVKITPEGKVKVLDFGLAKAMTGDGSLPDITHSPTLVGVATKSGVVMGTAAYMSPEQARGKSVDRRTDVWAFGAVLYEMLSGKKAFEGETVSDTLASILTKDPDWSALPTGTPGPVRRVLKRCLDRDTRTRLHDIADARLEMDEQPEVLAAALPLPQPTWRRAAPWGLSAILALIASAALLRPSRQSPSPTPPVVRMSRQLHGITRLGGLAISPDGTRVVFGAWDPSAHDRLELWKLEEAETQPIGASGLAFFSADGDWIGLVGEGKIRKAALSGGGFVDIAKMPSEEVLGACWTLDGQIVLGRRSGGLLAIPAAGGEFGEVTRAGDPAVSHRWPQVLPGDRALLFTIAGGRKGPVAAVVRFAKGKADGPFRELVSDAEAVRFVAPGHLVFRRAGRIFAAPFDPLSLTVTGPAVPVPGIAAFSSSFSSLAISATGTLVHAPRQQQRASKRLVWVDRRGGEVPLDLQARDYYDPSISPDGSRIAISIQDESTQHIWVITPKAGALTRLTFGETRNMAPVWTPDGRRIVYLAGEAGSVLSRSADGSGSAVTLSPKEGWSFPTSWSSDGRALAIWSSAVLRCEEPGGTKGPCRVENLIGDKHALAQYFSPDGRYLAYASGESGSDEVYVQAYPGPGGRWQVSAGGGAEPRWSRDGKELFYRTRDALMAVSVTLSPTFSFGAPRKLFEALYAYVGGVDNYDVGPDGRFLFMKNVEGTSDLSLELVLNWPTELARLAPPGATK